MLAKLGRVITGKKNEVDEPAFSYFSPGLGMRSQPNLTVFHSKDNDFNDDDDSDDKDNNDNDPPPSPSKRSFRTFWKRSSKLAFDMHHPESTSQMSLPLPKKKRGTVQADTFGKISNYDKLSLT